MPEFEIDKKRAVFTYAQFMRHIHPEQMLINCPYCRKHATMYILMGKNEWYCHICNFGGEIIWDESHVIFKKEPV